MRHAAFITRVAAEAPRARGLRRNLHKSVISLCWKSPPFYLDRVLTRTRDALRRGIYDRTRPHNAAHGRALSLIANQSLSGAPRVHDAILLRIVQRSSVTFGEGWRGAVDARVPGSRNCATSRRGGCLRAGRGLSNDWVSALGIFFAIAPAGHVRRNAQSPQIGSLLGILQKFGSLRPLMGNQLPPVHRLKRALCCLVWICLLPF